MMFNHDRIALRKMYFDSWAKYMNKQPLSELEIQIARVIEHHPEYHHYLSNLANLDKDFLPETGDTNPFLHMGLHLALIEQIATNRPYGITVIYQKLCQRNDEHDVQHKMIDCLAESIWLTQKNNTAPDESEYLKQLKMLLQEQQN
ncbi:DUF1841 family protein [Facilibium subflavum]|uniref:DUF1841 family protein n=1 Tax=Facilibium subflavum TaxID=2219058 RepID=UPI000E64DB47|nr:DUF1841 family protein [Facilibium subflavum]